MSALISPFIGGGFGGKLSIRADALLAALARAQLGRPVKVALPRPLMFNNTTHRPATDPAHPHRRRAATARSPPSATRAGRSRRAATSYAEPAVERARALYAAPNRLTAIGSRRSTCREGNAMRAPGEAPGMMALEIAMDEMAEKLGLDPIEFRIRNDTQVDPEKPGGRSRSATSSSACAPAPSASAGASAPRTPGTRPRRALAGRHGRRRRVPRQPR